MFPKIPMRTFFSETFRATADPRFRSIQLPPVFDRTREILQLKLSPVCHLLGTMRFSRDKLYLTGYRHRYGILEAHKGAFEVLGCKETA